MFNIWIFIEIGRRFFKESVLGGIKKILLKLLVLDIRKIISGFDVLLFAFLGNAMRGVSNRDRLRIYHLEDPGVHRPRIDGRRNIPGYEEQLMREESMYLNGINENATSIENETYYTAYRTPPKNEEINFELS